MYFKEIQKLFSDQNHENTNQPLNSGDERVKMVQKDQNGNNLENVEIVKQVQEKPLDKKINKINRRFKKKIQVYNTAKNDQ